MGEFTSGLLSMSGVLVGAGISFVAVWLVDSRKTRREEARAAKKELYERYVEQRRCIDQFDRLTMQIQHHVLPQGELESLREEGVVLGTKVDFAFHDEQLGNNVSTVVFAFYDSKVKSRTVQVELSVRELQIDAKAKMRASAKRLRDEIVATGG